MKGFAVSNIAWPPAERLNAYRLLAKFGITGLEIAPGMIFADAPDAFAPPASLLRERISEIEDSGLTLVSMQSLLFGVQDVSLFGSPTQREGFCQGLRRAIRLAAELSIPHLVLGSPRERMIPPEMPRPEAEGIVCEILGELADYAAENGCRIGLEPNPKIYGTNFAMNTSDAERIVRLVDRTGLMLTIDTGGMIANGEIADAGVIFAECADLIGHVHISEPHLEPAPRDSAVLDQIISALRVANYPEWMSVEMRSAGAFSLDRLKHSLEKLRTTQGQTA
ncbi:sugar phosphate isomerase/epimerase family protein [Paracoccus zhejiangensis]|nr:sugar phosphate isomerase/epimerase family protein [Paracoccus zhejiangensis]